MLRLTSLVSGLALAACLCGPVHAQDQTLADIRQELTVLYVEVQRLKRELSTTGGVNVDVSGSSAQQRMDRIEGELQRLTGLTEQLDFRINQVVSDGTNRIGDLEFRLVELEGGDISKLGETTTLGGGTAAPAPAQPVQTSDTNLAIGEQGDFESAKRALDNGDAQSAAEKFAVFTQTYTRGPLTGEAHYYRGEALNALGETTNAARAFLESYSGSPDSPRAPDALYKLGAALGELGQLSEACVTLGQVANLYPAAVASGSAASKMQTLGCN